MKKTTTTLLLIAVTIITTFSYSCKKDRVEKKQLNEYTPVNQYLDSKKQQEQEFIITGPSNDTIIGNQGTRIYGSKNCLVDVNGDTIDYPFSIKLVELYTPKDMIYWQMPTVASGNILQTDGEIRIRATKNNVDLFLKPSCPYGFEMPNSAPNSSMTQFSGADNGSFVNWTNTTVPFTLTSYGYLGSTNAFGWINADIQIGNNSGHTLTFTSSTDNLANVGIFVYFTSTNGVMQVYNMASGQIPNGSNVKIVMMAIGANGGLFTYNETRTVNGSASIDVSLTSITDASLTSYLDGL